MSDAVAKRGRWPRFRAHLHFNLFKRGIGVGDMECRTAFPSKAVGNFLFYVCDEFVKV